MAQKPNLLRRGSRNTHLSRLARSDPFAPAPHGALNQQQHRTVYIQAGSTQAHVAATVHEQDTDTVTRRLTQQVTGRLDLRSHGLGHCSSIRITRSNARVASAVAMHGTQPDASPPSLWRSSGCAAVASPL